MSDSLLRISSSPASEATRSPEASRGASLSTIEFTSSGSSGTIRKVSGSGLPPSSLAPSSKASGFFSLACLRPSALETNSTDFTFSVPSSARRISLRSAGVASVFT